MGILPRYKIRETVVVEEGHGKNELLYIEGRKVSVGGWFYKGLLFAPVDSKSSSQKPLRYKTSAQWFNERDLDSLLSLTPLHSREKEA